MFDESDSVIIVKDLVDGELKAGLVDYNMAFAGHQGIILKQFIPVLIYKYLGLDLLLSTRLIQPILLLIALLGSFIIYRKLNYSLTFLSVFLFVWYFFIVKRVEGFSYIFQANADTHVNALTFMFLLLALFPVFDSRSYNKKSILLASFIGLFIGLDFSLNYLSVPILLSFFVVQVSLITKYFFIDKNKLNINIFRNYFFLFIFFFLGIIPWIYLGIKTNFANLTYRGGSFIASFERINLWEGLQMILFNNGILDYMPLWFTIIFYLSLMIGLIYIIRFSIKAITKKISPTGVIQYENGLLTYTVLSIIVFIALSSINTLIYTPEKHVPVRVLVLFIPMIIFIVSIVLIKLVRILKNRFLSNRSFTSKRFLFNLLKLLLTIFVVILFIRLTGMTFQIKEFSGFPPKYYTAYEGFYYLMGYESPLYGGFNAGQDFCSQLDNKFYKKQCFSGLMMRFFNLEEWNYSNFNLLDNEIKEWVFAHVVYSYFWQKGLNISDFDILDSGFVEYSDINNKELIIEDFKTRGVCADLYFHKYYDKGTIYNYIEKNNLDKEQCTAGICMVRIFEPGYNQFMPMLRFDKKSEINRIINEYGSACKTGIEFYEQDFRAFYKESLINDYYNSSFN